MRSRSTNWLAMLLSVVSLGVFWLMPVSPFLAMAAVSTTKNTTGWARTLAVLAAILCTAYGFILAMLFGVMIIRSLAI